ncbi:hypothetical protein [Acinetobacter soli]|uniref:hypothetical protein n=1 Tax=Acinetobacter soli TaxID=487316 RepID=UPI00125CA241|nr:hypothetical protein [Acinetobacter soli]
MNNYKIRVNNEAESREAQELFFELGYRSGIASNNHFPVLVVAHDCGYGPESTTAIGMDHEHHKSYAELTLPQLHDLVAQGKSKEQGLISGADALRALADGKEVEFENGFQNTWVDINSLTIDEIKGGYFIDSDEKEKIQTKFRIKPVKLEIEVPAPFDPKVGEEYYYPYPHSERGYALDVFKGGRITNQFGAWRKEADIKIVVEQLRKLKEHSK